MGANIRWMPTDTSKSIPTYTPSQFIEAMRRAFGAEPWTLRQSDLPTVRGMEAAGGHEHSGFRELREALEANEEIKVWPSY